MKRFFPHFVLGITVFAAGSAMADVTFYESENFVGRQISGHQSMANFRALDFNDRARSAIIEGGPWEVCIGTNFGDTCKILPAGRYPTLGDWSKKISSARPAGASPVAGIPAGGGTFYESENFGGRQISGSQSMPNFRALDFNDRARSAIIEGGPWQICIGTNFGGDCTVFPAGRYPSLGEWSQKISSARPTSMPMGELQPPAVALRPAEGIIFFESENFGGRQFVIDQPDPNFARSHARERAQSVVVEGGAWEICVDADFRGDCQILQPGRYPALGALTGRISSVRPYYDQRGEMPRDGMRGWASATLFSGPNLTGRALPLGGEGAGNLAGLFNDRTSSLRIDRGYWIFCSDANFGGECRTFGPGEYPGLPRELDNRISSGRRISNDYPYTQNPNWR
ncbi:MAG: beta/gamma crystallin-related protein [Casimicrobiaceae bacterium]